MRKRGMSHIEMVLSFVIFLAAVSAALFFFSPGNGERLVDSSISYAQDEIVDYIKTEVESYSIKATTNDNVLGVEIGGVPLEYGVRALDLDGMKLKAGRDSSGTVFVELGGKDFFMLEFSEFFDLESFDLERPEHDAEKYEIATNSKKEVISERKAEELVKRYETDYILLKEEFNLPGRVNFGFDLIIGDETTGASNEVPVGLQAFSKDMRVEIVTDEGEVVFGDLRVKVW